VCDPCGRPTDATCFHQPSQVAQTVPWKLFVTLDRGRIRPRCKANRKCPRALFAPPPRAGGRALLSLPLSLSLSSLSLSLSLLSLSLSLSLLSLYLLFESPPRASGPAVGGPVFDATPALRHTAPYPGTAQIPQIR
jgi:hypothetical protein